MAAFHKYPDEVRKVVFDFSSVTAVYSIALSSATVTQISPPDGALTVGSATVTATAVTVLVSAGTALATYELGCAATASDGQVFRINGNLLIRAANEV